MKFLKNRFFYIKINIFQEEDVWNTSDLDDEEDFEEDSESEGQNPDFSNPEKPLKLTEFSDDWGKLAGKITTSLFRN